MTATDGICIPCNGLDEAFKAEQTRKSNILLEARLLDAQSLFDASAEKYAMAARIEEQLVVRCQDLGLQEKAWHHHRSAIGCWARAGNLYTAIQLGDELLADPALPERLRDRVQSFQVTIRARRRGLAERAMAAEAAEAEVAVPA